MGLPVWRLRASLIITVVCGLAMTGCTGTGGPSASDATDLLTTTTVGELNASTMESDEADDSSTTADPTTTTSIATTTVSTTTVTTATSTSVAEAANDEETTTTASEEVAIEVIRPGDFGSFTSPSGNIACSMSVEFGASCFILEQQWTIEQPSGPDCAESDWGSAVDLTATGVSYPCYTDLAWDLGAPALAYGSRMEVGEISCTSRRSGMTCENASGGFEMARAQLRILVS